MGEINTYDEFGLAIIDVVRENKLQTILEIGSWDGTGSTQCFIEALKDTTNPKLFCIEIKKERFEVLKNNTKIYPWVECINTSTISTHTFIYKNFDEIWNSPFNKIKDDKQTVQIWYNNDLDSISNIEVGYLDKDIGFYDGVLIDGGEFFGYSEYKLVKDRTNVLFLDDYYNAFKTNQIAKELIQDPEWEVIAGNKYWRNGYAIFRRKKFIK